MVYGAVWIWASLQSLCMLMAHEVHIASALDPRCCMLRCHPLQAHGWHLPRFNIHIPSSASSKYGEDAHTTSIGDCLLFQSKASGVSGVTESTPSATGGPLSLLAGNGPPELRASRRREACDIL